MHRIRHLIILIILAFSAYSYALTQDVVFGLQGIGAWRQNTSFDATITITEAAGTVSITIPPLTFSLPAEASIFCPPQVFGFTQFVPEHPNAAGGMVYLKSGAIPKQYRPASPIGVSQAVTTSPSTGYYAVVTQEGNIRFAIPIIAAEIVGYTSYLGTGPITTPSVTISYPVLPTMPSAPQNFAFGTGHTQEVYFPIIPEVNQYLDAYLCDIHNNIFAAFWADNSTQQSYPFQAYGYAQIGTVNTDGSISLQSANTVITPPSGYYCSQGGIAINPTNTNNIIANSILMGAAGGLELWVSITNDGGSTWASKRIDTGSIPQNAAGDNNALFDQFGNYWVTNLAVVSGNTTLTILLSSDGGNTFSVAAEFNASSYASGGEFFDFDQMTFGSDGSGGYALYLVTDLITTSGEIPSIGYIPVTGNGAYGAAHMVPITSYNIDGIFGSPVATSSGPVYINYFSNNTDLTYGYYYIVTIPDGITGVNNQTFSNFNCWASNNFGLLIENHPGPGTSYTSTNAKAIRGQLPTSPVRCLAYDNSKSALYALMCNPDPIYSQNCSLYLVASKNGGTTWSAPYYIKDSPLGSCFQPSINVDSVTGNAFITWYDSRADLTANQYVQFYGAVVLSSILTEVINTIP